MATPPPVSSTAPVRHGGPAPRGVRPLLRRLAWLALPVLIVAGAIGGPIFTSYARTGAAYGARIGCACRYIQERPPGECRADFEPGMGLVTLSEDTAARSVTARFALGFAQTATYREGAGCQLEPWRRD